MLSFTNLAERLDDALVPSLVIDTVDSLAGQVGVTPSEIRFFLTLLLAYPLGYIWRCLPNAKARHIYSVVTGFYLLSFIIGHQWLYIFASSFFIYLFMAITGPFTARYTATISMAILAFGHLYRQYTDYLGWTLDWTMQQMIITQKLHALAYNIQDANDPNTTPEQKQRSIPQLPSSLEYYSFLLFPANIAIGPTFEYKDYIDFADGHMTSPSPFGPSLARFTQGLLYFALHQAINTIYPCGALLQDPKFMNNTSFLKRYLTVWIALLGVRFKYYFGWKIAEGACCISGLGYNGKNKHTHEDEWNRVENIDVITYEFSQSLKVSSASWNKTTNLWLRRYVYDRCPKKWRLYFTFLVSAFWHGFYPGYYMFFLSIAVASAIHRQVRRNIRPRFMQDDGITPGKYKGLYDVMSLMATTMTLNYFIMSFVVLALDRSLYAFRGFSFVGHVVLFLTVVLFNSGVVPAAKEKVAHAKTS